MIFIYKLFGLKLGMNEFLFVCVFNEINKF